MNTGTVNVWYTKQGITYEIKTGEHITAKETIGLDCEDPVGCVAEIALLYLDQGYKYQFINGTGRKPQIIRKLESKLQLNSRHAQQVA